MMNGRIRYTGENIRMRMVASTSAILFQLLFEYSTSALQVNAWIMTASSQPVTGLQP
jgi:hypothetical protein